jgi:hypothetical protein
VPIFRGLELADQPFISLIAHTREYGDCIDTWALQAVLSRTGANAHFRFSEHCVIYSDPDKEPRTVYAVFVDERWMYPMSSFKK